jgi:ketosteroid isomerase-like protein
MKSGPVTFVAALLIAATFWSGARSIAATDQKVTVATLQRLERDFMKATAERGAEGYLSYYADDAVEVPDGEGLVRGKTDIAKEAGYLNNKSNHIAWTPVGADVAAAGDLGYTFGTYEFHGVDKDGTPIFAIGKYATIWKLQKDGSWKVVLDMGNSSPTPNRPQTRRRFPLI